MTLKFIREEVHILMRMVPDDFVKEIIVVIALN